jgi:2-polyprenyl-3-methyl-5-hydroxy-6-metoxy-1,4-benzoquinol methylase
MARTEGVAAGMRELLKAYIGRVGKPQKENIVDDMHFKLAIDFIERRLSAGRGYNLLDIGCNVPPAFLSYMTGRHANLHGYGCDIRQGVESACDHGERLDVRYLDFSDSRDAYPPGFFDFIFAGEVIEHLQRTDNLVEQSLLHLKGGGYLIVTTPNLAAWYERVLLLFGMLPVMCEVSDRNRVFGRRRVYRLMGKTESRPVGHLRLFTPAALRELCEYHGFECVEHSGYWTLDFFLNRWISRADRNLAQGIFMVFRKPGATARSSDTFSASAPRMRGGASSDCT